MKNILFCLFLLANQFTYAQCDLPPGQDPINTGSNMTVMMLPGFVSGLNIHNESAYIIAYDGDLIVGYADLSAGITQNTISIWGDDTLTPEADGASGSASISFQLVDGSSLYDVIPGVPVSYTTGSISAQPNAPSSSTLVCEPVESIPECSSIPQPYSGNTGSNMTVMMLQDFISSLGVTNEEAYIVALSESGLIVGSVYFNSNSGQDLSTGQGTIAIWGDDTITPEVDGAFSGELITLQLVDGDSVFDILAPTSIYYSSSSISVESSAGTTTLLCTVTEAEIVNGCTDSLACNYNIEATLEDSSCEYAVENYDCAGVCLSDSDNDGVCDAIEIVGCQDITACNYNTSATDAGDCIYSTDLDACATCSGETDGTGTIVSNDSDNDGVCNSNEIVGCTDDTAANYNSLATDDDGSCDYESTIEDCVLPEFFSGNTGANMTLMLLPNFISSLPITDSDAYVAALTPSGMVVGSASVYGVSQNSIAIWGDSNTTPEIDGALTDEPISFQLIDGESLYDLIMPVLVSYTTGSIAVQPSAATSTLNCGLVVAIEGCTDATALNYDATATEDDSSCELTQVTFSDFTFTNCGQEGSSGPSQSQVNSEYEGTLLYGQVISNTGIQEWVVPFPGIYTIETYGASGGDDNGYQGGYGARMQGEFFLQAGDIINVLVGQKGNSEGYSGGSGGGGTFVTVNSTPYIVAGGGGGAHDQNGQSGVTEECGTGTVNYPESGGCDGNGGQDLDVSNGAPAGGGFYTNGGCLSCWTGVSGVGKSFVSGGQGGTSNHHGGFGGGASSWGSGSGGAAAGGWSGGGAQVHGNGIGGGGGSFNAGDNQENIAGFNEGHGQVIITYINYGCTDITACNYNPYITEDDGSCIYEEGEIAFNCNNDFIADTLSSDSIQVFYDIPTLTGTCTQPYLISGPDYDDFFTTGITEVVWGYLQNDSTEITCSFDVQIDKLGCTDSTACWFDVYATIDDGSCEEGDFLTIEMYDSYGDGWNGNTITINEQSFTMSGSQATEGACLQPLDNLCYNVDCGGGSYQYEVSWIIFDGLGIELLSGGAPFSGVISDGYCIITGCTDSTAFNFESIATIDDGSCDFPTDLGELECGVSTDTSGYTSQTYGFENSLYYSFSLADSSEVIFEVDDGYRPYLLLFGSDSSLITYQAYDDTYENNYATSLDSGSYTVVITNNNPGFYSGTLAEYYLNMQTEYQSSGYTYDLSILAIDGVCDYDYEGCTDSTAFNFESIATIDDGSCDFPTDLGELECGVSTDTSGYTSQTYGFENSLYYSFSLADSSEVIFEVDDGYRPYLLLFGSDSSLITYQAYDDTYENNYATSLDSGSYTVVITNNNPGFYSGTLAEYYLNMQTEYQSSGYTYDLSILAIDGVCDIYGCTDASSPTYNALATLDDGTCEQSTSFGTLQCGELASVANDSINSENVYKVYDFVVSTDDAEVLIDIDGLTYSMHTAIFKNGTRVYNYTNYNSFQDLLTLNLDYGLYHIVVSKDISSDFNYTNLETYINSINGGNYQDYDPYSTVLDISVIMNDGTCEYQTGCMDELAFNFNENAILDDGSCIPIILGCINSTAGNFDTQANTNDGTCEIYGCTLDLFPNYNSEATIEDGTCDMSSVDIFGCTNSMYFEFDSLATVDNGTCMSIINYGCTDSDMYSYDPIANVDDGSCEDLVYGCTHSEYIQYNEDANVDNGTCVDLISFGCIDESAFNFNVYANVDDGSCVSIVFGCLDSNYVEYNVEANTDDGSCATWAYYGCTDSLYLESWNYSYYTNTSNGSIYTLGSWDGNNVDDGSCATLITSGCYDDAYLEYNSAVNIYDYTCDVIAISGCTDSNYLEYWNGSESVNGLYIVSTPINEDVNLDDGSCLTPVTFGCIYDIYAEYSDQVNVFVSDSCQTIAVWGCTDSSASNYDTQANADDGSCIIVLEGCTDSLAFNYNSFATIDDGSCEAIVEGCMDALAFNFNVYANVENGDCIPVIYGCLDLFAINFNSDANTSDDSCIDTVLGCTDSNSYNYNPNANTEDDSCVSYEVYISNLESTNSNLDSINSSISSELDVILQAYGLLELNYENCEPNLYGKLIIDLHEGWNMIGYNLIYPSDPESHFEAFVNDLHILKNNDGDFYWPEYNYNGLGQLSPGQGYQLRMLEARDGFYFE